RSHEHPSAGRFGATTLRKHTSGQTEGGRMRAGHHERRLDFEEPTTTRPTGGASTPVRVWTHNHSRLPWAGLMALALGVSAVLMLASESAATAKFGALCQRDFQNGWLPTLGEVWNRCQGFVDELDASDTKAFYWTLHGKKPFIETDNDQDVAETVHLLYMNTHGGAWSDTATYAMWDKNARAFT